ncbi:hypothetical protein ALC56_03060 [Trachymyrmex septentrionalis]|uniref:Uncharacterized protein n=1 Tax=Trachymyrmex septentrionalis TaxID=34720 RepID=A0A195FRH5_9HYME|nr:hypothetical protein ALC56_03060 [Trachymyrmex septentrionalis]
MRDLCPRLFPGYRCIALDIAAGRKLTTGLKVHTARNPYGAKTVLSPFRYYESGDKN